MANTIGELNVEIGAKLDKLEAGLNRMEKSIGHAGKQSEKTASQSFSKVGGIIAGSFSIQAISSFARAVIEVRSEFEKFEAVLTNTLGSSSAAQLALADIKDMAAMTPFSVAELSGAFVKLTNYGLKPSMEAMRQYGDLASAVGKGFDQLAEAVADATTGEFERLKEFGIKSKKEGDKVTFTFKEQATQVDFTADAIENYITSLGDLEGVSGSMAAISETLGGKVSNLGDSFDSLLNTIGDTSAWGDLVTALADTLRGTEALIKGLESDVGGVPWYEKLAMIFDMTGFGQASLISMGYMQDALDKAALKTKAFEEELNKLNETAGWSLSYGMEQAGDNIDEVADKAEKATESFVRLGKEIRKNRTSKETGKAELKGEFDFRPPTEFGDIIRIDPEIQDTLLQQQEQLRLFEEQLAFTALTAETFGGVLQSSFEAALISGENFVEVFGDAIKNLILQLISAAATAAILAAVLAPISGVGFGATFRGLFLGTPGQGGGMGGNFGQFFVSGSNLVTSTNRARKQEGRSVR